MNKKFFIYPYILLFIAFYNLPLLRVIPSQLKTEKKISVEFLNKLPSNDYIIGPGDKLRIIISRDIPLIAEAIIDGEGTIYLPKLERVFVNGLTINELNSLLNQAYLEFIKFPKVETIVVKYRPINVFVEGEVINPGIKLMEGSLSLQDSRFSNSSELGNKNIYPSKTASLYFPTVFDAIRASDGITEFSDLKNIQIIRKDNISNGSGKITTTLNFEDLLSIGKNSQNIRIYDSDIIKVGKSNKSNKNILTKAILSNLNPKFINVIVTGRVNRPGPQKVSRASVLSDAVDISGGAKILKGPVTFIRFENNGTIDKRRFRYTRKNRGKFSNPNLRDGDVIIVGDNFFTTTNEVIQEITSPFTGVLSTYGVIKAISDL